MVIVTGENRRTGREEQPAQCQFVHHKSHTDRPGIEPRPTKDRRTTKHLSHGTGGKDEN